MSIPSLELALNAVQVIHFTIKQGYKIAIHCHAGLGKHSKAFHMLTRILQDEQA